jgi:valyl-tRNA synthetase
MPFITEEIWQKLNEAKLLQTNPLLLVTKWPEQ